ncbi:MAG: SpoIID/LytB domain-containing protein [Acidimicrobiales bacterium]
MAATFGLAPAAGAVAGPQRAQVPVLAPAAAPAVLPADSTDVRIAMTENDTLDVIVASSGGVSGPGVAGAPAVRFHPIGSGRWDVTRGTGCGGPWAPTGQAPVATPVASPVSPADLLTLCVAGTQSTNLQGVVAGAYNSNGQSRTVDTLPLEEYVADVVPGESPSSWATLGGPGPQDEPWGFQELEAQAVAARSYVLSDLGGYGGYADTCDLTCQTYRGTRYLTPASAAAAQDTAGQVMVMPGGRIATTEYSSSTGGYTSSAAEGSPFTPVPDAGDAVSGNVHHTWTASVPLVAMSDNWPQYGPAPSVTVARGDRNGFGTWGGRVTQVTLAGNGQQGTVLVATFLAQVDGSLGRTVLQSNWFTVTSESSQSLQVTGHGWGHGIGMGQWGALGYALGQDGGQGNWRYLQIVGHYYQPASLQPLPGSPTFGKPSGGVGGYWEVASDGGIFSFGNAAFHGSMGGKPLNQPVVGMAATPTGGGYWEVASDGGIFSFGNAAFSGSAAGTGGGPGTVALLATRTGQGYLDVTTAGRSTSYGDAPHLGDLSTAVPGYPGGVRGGAVVPG